ncbi:unnamed protein product, partial [Effrenium voratum]
MSTVELSELEAHELPSFLTMVTVGQAELAQERRVVRMRLAKALCILSTLVGAFALAVLNSLAALSLSNILRPGFPVLTPLLFVVFAICTARTISGAGFDAKPPPRLPSGRSFAGRSLRSWGLKYFHLKVAVLELVQLANQLLRLVTMLSLGQSRVWISVHAVLICINAFVSPRLHFSPEVQVNTFFMMLFSGFMSVTFGACLPCLMVAEVTWLYFLHAAKDNMSLQANFVQAFVIGEMLVPKTFPALLSLLWPFISLNLRLAGLEIAELWSHPHVVDSRARVPCRRLYVALFVAIGATAFLLGITAIDRSPCAKKPWRASCRVFSFDLFAWSCGCIYYMETVSGEHLECDSFETVQAMLRDSKGLRVFVMQGCEKLSALPSFEQNLDLEFLVVSRNNLSTLPSLSRHWRLQQIIAGQNMLRSLPELHGNTELVELEVPDNRITMLPSLEANHMLTSLQVDANMLRHLPDVKHLRHLETFSAGRNLLRELPALPSSCRLKGIFMTGNNLRSVPSMSHCRSLETVSLGWNQLTSVDLPKSPLRSLYLTSNRFSQLPSFPCARLEALDVGSNKLKTLPDLSHCKQLKVLQAGSNILTTLPDLSENPQLLSLSVGENLLQQLVVKSPRMVKLQASANSLQRVDLRAAPKLAMLYLTKNKLTQLDLSANGELIEVVIANNDLESADFVSYLEKVTLLNLMGNRLRSLPRVVSKSLIKLDLSDNFLQRYGPVESQVLKDLLLSNNELTQLPDPSAARILEMLDLERNAVCQLPSFAQNLQLRELRAGHNCLQQLPSLSQNMALNVLSVPRNNLSSLPELPDRQLVKIDVRENKLQ